MALEIERKFLVSGEFMSQVSSSSHIVQGYICKDKGRTVRVRIRGDKGYLTIKGASDERGLSRYEWEREISLQEAEELMKLSATPVIDKTRYLVPFEGHTFEVDVFHGCNEGLVMAEVELGSPDESFARPGWLGDEVSGDRRYYNSCLTEHPFCTWK